MNKIKITNSRDKTYLITDYPAIRSATDIHESVSDYLVRIISQYHKRGVCIKVDVQPDIVQKSFF